MTVDRAPAPPKTGAEGILLAEDDVDVRDVSKGMLEKFGYKVFTAENGAEAVNKFSENRDSVRLLVFDVLMPGMNGKEAYEEIRKIRDDVKVLFLTGYPSDVLKKNDDTERGPDFLLKPVSMNNLLKKVRDVLDD